ncbi:hypothetical protein [Kitasatospora sp. NPDC127060]|uniref:hypothetical protein n=1 Tax=Kitasatospora sp. NPDC127060 TaxID=3347121 RepID=UPI00364639B3
MGVLHLTDGRIVGYRVNGRDYPITMANAKRALNVAYCAQRFGRGSNFTAYELEKFGDETGLPPYDPLTWWIVRGISRFVEKDAHAVECASTVTADEAPRPTVPRPAARAHAALPAAQKDYEASQLIAQAAALAMQRGSGRVLEQAGRALGKEGAAELMASLRKHARLAEEAAEATKGLFVAACDAADEASQRGRQLDVIREGWAAERAAALVAQVTQRAADAALHLHRAENVGYELSRAAERWARRAG